LLLAATLSLARPTDNDQETRFCTISTERLKETVRGLEKFRHGLALVLACVEGVDDERSALSAVDSIVQRYVAAVEAEGWEPPFASRGDRSEDAE